MKNASFFGLMALLLLSHAGQAQSTTPPINWQLLDWKTDGYPGMSVEKAYNQLLKNRKPVKKIVVAVIDDGLDDRHPDLMDVEWTNTGEIPGNGIDDDHNGFVDDVHGWNFIGTTRKETYEEIREFVRLRRDSAHADAVYWRLVSRKERETLDQLRKSDQGPTRVIAAFEILQAYWRKKLLQDSICFVKVKKTSPDVYTDTTAKAASAFILSFTNQVMSISDSTPLQTLIGQIATYRQTAHEAYKIAQDILAQDDPAYFRRMAIGDDPYENTRPGYGNGITFPDDDHGTECAGIIGAQRKDPGSSMGISNSVQIMPLRINSMGHDCDEWDKDVANAIRYAVDNGARVVSMSFGKYISPQQDWVTTAIRYAEKKGVLLVHAAMNDGIDIDTVGAYPSAWGDKTHPATNFINVGASTYDSTLIANFSNYGKKKVDVFAPGVAIYMTKINNQHERGFGTSFACPMVAGLAAMIWSYYPDLTYQQVRECIERSASPIGILVTIPGESKKALFSSLSKTGGIVNAYRAIQYAQNMNKR